MRWPVFCLLLVFLTGLTSWFVRQASSQTQPVRKKFGLEKRIPWTTSRIKGTPEPPPPYKTEVAFANLKFVSPLDIANAPGSNRLFVAERKGKIYSFVNNRNAKKKNLLIDVKKELRGVALHPQFAKNGVFFVSYVIDWKNEKNRGMRVARFRAKGKPPRADIGSGKKIIEWPAEGHTGGGMRFGPDGYLYIGVGDASGIADGLHTGQDISDLAASILRIDVDRAPPGKPYRVPKDNPFIKRKNARPEIWAYGLRQPWRFSFDKKTGDLWAGDVGQDLWEMVYKIEKGGNYGWSVMEGTHPFRPERKKGPTPILKPVVEHSHSDFRSVTGGFVYHGKRLKQLNGAYIYGDFDTGRIWGLRYDGKKVTWNKELVDTNYRIIAFAEDNAGELFILDFMGGQIHRLAPRPKVKIASTFPRKLSETGLFASVKDLKPAPGLIPYTVNSPLWGDHTAKERYLALPGNGKIEFDVITYPQPSPGAPPGWRFPDGTVLVKTFFLEMERGNPKSKRRLETRILHYEQLKGTDEIGAEYWRGYTYVWNDDQTDAFLLDAKGMDRTYQIRQAKTGRIIKQKYHFPSRAECTLCHTMAAKFALGVNTLQMNKDHDYGGVIANQLRTLEHIGVFTKPLPKPPEQLPRLVNHLDERQPLDRRARSYLHSNCAHCHIKWGGGNADFFLLATLPLKDMGIVNTPPGQGDFDIKNARILAPGHPERSLIYYRITKTGLGRMPHIATSIVDEKAAKVVRRWIAGMK